MAARAGLEACLTQSEGHDGGRGVIYLTASADAMKTGIDLAGRLGDANWRRKISICIGDEG